MLAALAHSLLRFATDIKHPHPPDRERGGLPEVSVEPAGVRLSLLAARSGSGQAQAPG